MIAEKQMDNIGHLLWATVRRVFRRCQGKPVNFKEREMTPEEAEAFHEEMVAHGFPLS